MSLQHYHFRNSQLCDINSMNTIPHVLTKLDRNASSSGVSF